MEGGGLAGGRSYLTEEGRLWLELAWFSGCEDRAEIEGISSDKGEKNPVTEGECLPAVFSALKNIYYFKIYYTYYFYIRINTLQASLILIVKILSF